MAVPVRRLAPPDGPVLRAARLAALADSPAAFGSTLAAELGHPPAWWSRSVAELAWFVAGTAGDGEGDVVGLVAGAHDRDGAREVVSMWVAPAQRGTGVADLLLAAVERWAAQDGATALVLGVTAGNDRAQRFYARHGFVVTEGPRPMVRDPGRCALFMRRELGPPPVG